MMLSIVEPMKLPVPNTNELATPGDVTIVKMLLKTYPHNIGVCYGICYRRSRFTDETTAKPTTNRCTKTKAKHKRTQTQTKVTTNEIQNATTATTSQ